jgi:hypothetical protein
MFSTFVTLNGQMEKNTGLFGAIFGQAVLGGPEWYILVL